MKVETKFVTSVKITEVDGLDPVTVTLEPESATAGRLTVTCYDRSWVTYFGSHGSDGLAAFIETVPTDYLVNRLATVEETEYVMDADALCQAAKKEVLSQRRSWVITAEDRWRHGELERGARELFDACDAFRFCEDIRELDADIMQAIFGDEWWYAVPNCRSQAYKYLARIVAAVQEGLRQYHAQLGMEGNHAI